MSESAIEDTLQPVLRRAADAPRCCFAAAALDCVLRLVRSPAFAYAIILLLQLKVVWRAWDLRDLTMGDTPDYYVRALTWCQDWMVNIVWSPLYLAFYGTLMHLTRDAFTVTTLHRLVIVFLATAGVLAVLRRMLPHWIALLGAAWWAILPINFDTLYEVHLFALLPVLAAWLVILRRPRRAAGGQWCRSIALAILVLSTFLVRNETIVAVGCLGLVCLIYEWHKWRQAAAVTSAPGPSRDESMGVTLPVPSPSPGTPGEGWGEGRLPEAQQRERPSPYPLPGYREREQQFATLGYAGPTTRREMIWRNFRSAAPTLFRYALPTFLVLLLVVGAYFRSFIRFGGYVLNGQPQPYLRDVWHIKHTLNMAQVYAFGYQQRHPEWDKNPWTECGELSRRTFGRPDPTIGDMLRHNPRATLEHFAWNCRLVPAGLQVLLFNATSFHDDPDYAPVNIDPVVAVPLSLSALALVAVGLALLAFRWRYWWDYWLRDRAWGWAAMLAVAVTVLFIIPTQRPRPSYLFSFSVLLMTITGMSLCVILHTLTGWFGLGPVRGKPARAWAPAVAAVLLAGIIAAVLRIMHVAQHPRPHYFLHLSPLTVLLAGRALVGACIFLLALALAGLFELRLAGGRAAPGKSRRAWVTVGVLAAILVADLWAMHVSQQPRHHRFLGLTPPTVLLAGSVVAGTCVFLLVLALGVVASTRESGIFAPVLPLVMAAVMAGLIVLVPPYYVAHAEEGLPQSQRPLLRTYLALRPYQAYIERRDTVFLKGAYHLEMRYYLGMAEPDTMDYSVLDEMKSGEQLASFLDRKHVNLFFLDNVQWSQMESDRPGVIQDLIDHGNADGWQLVGFKDQPTAADSGYEYLARWLLFRKAHPE